MSFHLVARILRSRAHVSVRTNILSSRQWQAPQRVTKQWLSTVKLDNLSFRVALEKGSDHLDEAVKKDAEIVLEEIRNSILRNVTRILTHQPHVKKDWERNLRKLERTQFSSDLPWNVTTSQLKLSAPGGDALPWETTSNAKCEALPWDKPVDDTLHVGNVSKDPQMGKVCVSNNVAFDATREEAATSKKDPVEGLSPSANTRVSTTFPNSEPEPCKDESLMSTSQVRVNVMRGDSIDKALGMSDDTLRSDKSSKMDSAMSTNETNSRREQPSLLELLRQPLEDEFFMMEKVVTTLEKVSNNTWPSQPSSLLDLLNDDSATTSAIDTHIVQNTFRVDVPSESSTSWANYTSGFGNDSIETQVAVKPQPLIDLLRRPMDDESPSIEGENGQIASSAAAKPKMRVEGVATANMSAFDFDNESSDIIPPLGSSDQITDNDEDDNKVAPDMWSDDLKEKPNTLEKPKVQVKESGVTAIMPSFDFGNDLDDAMPTLGSGEETLHERSDNNRLAPENWNSVSGTGHSWQTDHSTTSLVGEDMEYQTTSSVLDQGLAILLAMKDRDWEQLEPVTEFPEEEFPPEEKVIEIELERHSESEESSDEDEDKVTSLDDNEDDASLLNDIRDLLEWTSFGEILLYTADYNVVLLQLATSTLQTEEAIKMMVKTYRHMTEVGRSDSGCAPDAITYTILMVALDRRAKAPSSAADICREMMSSNVKLRPEALVQGIRSFQRHNDVKDAECLLNSALDSESHETTVPVSAWLGVLRMYKQLDMQQEAVNLVTRYIQVNGAKDNRCVSKVITDAIYWPSKDFRGRSINSSQLLTKVLDLLESSSLRREGGASMDTRDVGANEGTELSDSNWVGLTDDASLQSVKGRENDWKKPSYMPSYMTWRQLILSLSTAAEAEAGPDWPIVHRAFTAMQNSLAAFCPDALILKVGIRTAEMTRDADLATDLVIRAQDAEFDATYESHADSLWLDNGQAVGDPESESVFLDPTKSDLDSMLVVVVKGSDDLSESTDTSLNESVGNADIFNAQEVEQLFYSDIINPDILTLSSYKPRHNSVRATPQAFASAIRLCVATGNMTSAEKLLTCLRDPRNTFPSSVKSDLYTLAMKGYAKVGDSDTALNLLKEMQNYGPKPTEEAYGTVIHSLAVAKRTEEAGELFRSMDTGQFRDNVTPGLTCHDGRMLAYMEANAWEETLAFHSKMKEAGIPWSPLCFQGVLLASSRLGDRAKALEAIEGALGSGMKMDHYCCELSMRIILGDVLKTGKIDQARSKLRHIGKKNRFLKPTSLNLSRALRAAEVEERRQPTNGLKLHEIVLRRNRAWNNALQHLLYFARAIEKEDSEVISN